MLRDYQQRAIDQLYAWLSAGNKGHPCLVLPTGSGKSHIIAAMVKDALQNWPELRVLMLTHQKELIEQNAQKMRQHWPGAPMGIYSASLRSKTIGEPITFAGIQSIRNKSAEIGHMDIVIIDECHMCGHAETGGYRKVINELTAINPELRVIGLTATPYRLGHGLITDQPALFDALIEPVSIEELIYKGHLCTLRSKVTKQAMDITGVHKRGGEFIDSELQAAVDTNDINARVVSEVIQIAGDRKAWLFFCVGVAHAQRICDVLNDQGIKAACVTGSTPQKERNDTLEAFKRGEIRALTNANVLTTGFDHPAIDVIAMLRPTMSPGLYVQMAGRGMRPHPDKKDCLVLDFAGVVATHGPITAVRPPEKGTSGDGDAPVRACPDCGELVHISVMTCTACGHAFPPPAEKPMKLSDEDIMGIEGREIVLTSWRWDVYVSKASGKTMLRCTYYGQLSDAPIYEYLPVMHDGYAGHKAMNKLVTMAHSAGVDTSQFESLDNDGAIESIADIMNRARPPSEIEYKADGKFFRVMNRMWE